MIFYLIIELKQNQHLNITLKMEPVIAPEIEFEIAKEIDIHTIINKLTYDINCLAYDINNLKEEKKKKMFSIQFVKQCSNEQKTDEYECNEQKSIEQIDKLLDEKNSEIKTLRLRKKKLQLEKKKIEKREEKKKMDGKLKILTEDFEKRKEQINAIQEELENLKKIRDEKVGDLDRQINYLQQKCEELGKCSHTYTKCKPINKNMYYSDEYYLVTCKICNASWEKHEERSYF